MYLIWKNKTITDFTDNNINSLYNEGYLFARTGKGEMCQTRSVRIDLKKFELSSENKRVLRNTKNLFFDISPIPYENYHWGIHKLGKDFYTKKFGDKTFSAQKIKELATDSEKSNFNRLLAYRQNKENLAIGYCIALETNEFLHYSYPFYDLDCKIKNLGIGMMTHAVVWAQKNGKKYIYLGSAKDEKAKYKLQFSGIEWFDGKKWNNRIDDLKKIL
jgi:arginyl-tRNA--protein-N-Asp/Glu arginylyltransferase